MPISCPHCESPVPIRPTRVGPLKILVCPSCGKRYKKKPLSFFLSFIPFFIISTFGEGLLVFNEEWKLLHYQHQSFSLVDGIAVLIILLGIKLTMYLMTRGEFKCA